MATLARSPVDRLSAERRFYSRMALFMVALVFIGFAPSFSCVGWSTFRGPIQLCPHR